MHVFVWLVCPSTLQFCYGLILVTAVSAPAYLPATLDSLVELTQAYLLSVTMELHDSTDYGRRWPFRSCLALPITIRQYIAREQLCTGSDQASTPSFKALNHCLHKEIETGINIIPLFWATQTRARQLFYVAPILRPVFDEPRFLCVKCGRWVTSIELPAHLPTREMKQFMRSHPARAWEIVDATADCLAKMEERYSLVEDQSMRVQVMHTEDWPAVCPMCSCVVMSSFLPTHMSDPRYCEHAKLTWLISTGHLTRSRYNWFPGHPLVHHFFVGKWNTLAVLAVCIPVRNKLRAFYRPALLLCALGQNGLFDQVADSVMDFCGFNIARLHGDFRLIHAFINDGCVSVAWTFYRLMLKSHVRMLKTNFLCFQ